MKISDLLFLRINYLKHFLFTHIIYFKKPLIYCQNLEKCVILTTCRYGGLYRRWFDTSLSHWRLCNRCRHSFSGTRSLRPNSYTRCTFSKCSWRGWWLFLRVLYLFSFFFFFTTELCRCVYFWRSMGRWIILINLSWLTASPKYFLCGTHLSV